MRGKIIVTGANGFTGKYLMRELAEYGFQAVGIWHHSMPEHGGEFEWHRIDLTDGDACERLVDRVKPDAIIHLAAQNSVPAAKQNPGETLRNNVLAAVNILEACRKSTGDIRCMLAGSAAVYDMSACSHKITEDMPVLPRNTYALTKYFQEQMAQRYRADYGMDILCTRPFNYSGYCQGENCFLPNLCRQVSRIAGGRQEPKLNLGNLQVGRDFLDVRDVACAYRLLLDEDVPSGIYNISSDSSVKLIDIADYLCHKAGIEIEIHTDESLLRKDDVPYICGSAEKIKAATNWKADHSVFDTVNWIYESMQEEMV